MRLCRRISSWYCLKWAEGRIEKNERMIRNSAAIIGLEYYREAQSKGKAHTPAMIDLVKTGNREVEHMRKLHQRRLVIDRYIQIHSRQWQKHK